MPMNPSQPQNQSPTASRIIPQHPLQAARAAAQGTPLASPAPNPQSQADWFARAGDSSDEAILPPESSLPEPPPVPQQPESTEDIDALLKDIGEPEPPTQPTPPAPTESQPQGQPQAAPPSADPTAMRKQAIDYLMASEYRMDDTTARRLISEPETVLPEIAARVHVNIMGDLGKRVSELLPTMVDAIVQQRLNAHSAELEFFGRYPQINRPEWRPVVAQSLAFVKQMNPGYNRDQLMQQGAALAAYQIRRTFRGTQATPQPGRAPVPPYTPVPPGGGAPMPQRPQEGNIWAQMAADPNLFDF